MIPFSFSQFLGRTRAIPVVFMAAGLLNADDSAPDADPLISSVLSALTEASAFEVEVAYTMRVRMGDMDDRIESRYTFAYEKPNKLASIFTDGMVGQTVISNGDEMMIHLPLFDSYTISAAPADLESLFAEAAPLHGEFLALMEAVMTQKVAGQDLLSLLKIVDLPSNPTEEEDRRLVRLRFLSERFIEGLSEEELAEISDEELAMARDNVANMDIDVILATDDPDRPLVLRISADLTETVRSMSDQHSGMPEMEDMEMEMIFEFDDWRFSETLPAERFAFSPPEDARQVDDLMGAIEDWAPEGLGEREPHALLGEPAPTFSLEMLDGGEVSLAGHLGEDIVILDFWATWCGPCIQAMPTLMEVAGEYEERGVVLYAINVREEAANVAGFLEERGWELRVPMDPQGEVGNLYQVTGIPQTVVIGEDGSVQAVHIGYSAAMGETLRHELDSLLAGESLHPGDR